MYQTIILRLPPMLLFVHSGKTVFRSVTAAGLPSLSDPEHCSAWVACPRLQGNFPCVICPTCFSPQHRRICATVTRCAIVEATGWTSMREAIPAGVYHDTRSCHPFHPEGLAGEWVILPRGHGSELSPHHHGIMHPTPTLSFLSNN